MSGYGRRLICYIDILGFKSIIDDLRKGTTGEKEKKVSDLSNMYRAIQATLHNFSKEHPKPFDFMDTALEYVQFSDTVVISTTSPLSSMAVFQFHLSIKSICHYLMIKGWTCRGAIMSGDIEHDGDRIYGTGLADVESLERKAALFPRIILSRETLEELKLCTENDDTNSPFTIPALDHFLEEDSDGFFYVDYIANMFPLDLSAERGRLADIIKWAAQMNAVIRKGIADRDPRVRQKYGWLRSKYTEYVLALHTSARKTPARSPLLTIPLIE